MKIGDLASYTFMDKRIFVNSFCIYEKTQPYTIKGIVIAVKEETIYLRTKYGVLEKPSYLIQKI